MAEIPPQAVQAAAEVLHTASDYDYAHRPYGVDWTRVSVDQIRRLLDGLAAQGYVLVRDAAVDRAEQAGTARDRVRELHQPLQRGGLTVCTECSGWDGSRCRGEIEPHPCPTLAALDVPADGEQPGDRDG